MMASGITFTAHSRCRKDGIRFGSLCPTRLGKRPARTWNRGFGLPIIRTSVDHGTALDLAAAAFNNWHIHGCGSHSTEEMWPEILDMMRSGRFDLAALITHEFPLERITEALDQAGRADEAQKVCITFPA
mgnify:CR=1 FL=1